MIIKLGMFFNFSGEAEVKAKISDQKLSRVHKDAALECDRKLAAMQIK